MELNFDLFKETLNKYYEIMEDLEKVSYYAMLQLETDVTNKDSNKIYSICVNIATKVSNATSFFMPKILKTDAKKIQAWINKPELKEKKIAIEKILREKKPYFKRTRRGNTCQVYPSLLILSKHILSINKC